MKLLQSLLALVFSASCGGTATNPPTGGTQEAGSPGAACALASECSSALVCTMGHCRSECETNGDCPPGARCVRTGPGGNACMLPAESACHVNSDCKDPLVCAPDMQCRNQCTVDRDCVKSAQCSAGVCMDTGIRDG